MLIDGNALPCRACFVNVYTEREYDVWTGLTLPSCYSNKSMYGTNSKNIQVLGQLNHICVMTSQTRSFMIGQEFVLLQSENQFAASLVCVRLFLTLELARRFIFLTLCVPRNM